MINYGIPCPLPLQYYVRVFTSCLAAKCDPLIGQIVALQVGKRVEAIMADSPKDMVEWFGSTIQKYDATFLVYYRGLW